VCSSDLRLHAAAEVGELLRRAGLQVEREEVVAAAVDDAAVGAEAGAGLAGRRAREAREAVGFEVVEEEVAVVVEDAAGEVGVVGEAVGVPALEAGREVAPLLGRDEDEIGR